MFRSIRIPFFLLLIGIFFLSLYTPPPPGAIGPYLNGVFPESAPGVGGSWELEDPLPGINFPSPVRLLPFPGSPDILVLSKMGEDCQPHAPCPKPHAEYLRMTNNKNNPNNFTASKLLNY